MKEAGCFFIYILFYFGKKIELKLQVFDMNAALLLCEHRQKSKMVFPLLVCLIVNLLFCLTFVCLSLPFFVLVFFYKENKCLCDKDPGIGKCVNNDPSQSVICIRIHDGDSESTTLGQFIFFSLNISCSS